MSKIQSSIDDAVRAVSLMRGIVGDVDDVQYLVIEGAPASKARPRFGRGGVVFTPKESRAAEKRTAERMRKVFREPLTGNVSLACVFFRPNRQRIDADNMLKHVCDAANGVIWEDDSQVTAISAVVELDEANPRTLVAVSSHQSSMVRGTDAVYPCAKCGTPIPMIGKTRKTKHCSAKCAYEAREKPPLKGVPCAQCKQEFRPSVRTQKLCSEACRVEWMRGRNQRSRRAMSDCMDCGTQLSHSRGGRCRPCWRLSVAEAK